MYRGLGFALQTGGGALPPCLSMVPPPGWVGPIECDPTSGGPVYSPATDEMRVSSLERAFQTLQESMAGGAPAPAANESLADWLNRNALKLGLGALAGLMFVSIARGGRR